MIWPKWLARIWGRSKASPEGVEPAPENRFIPVISEATCHCPRFGSSLRLPPQESLEDKIGGLPWGLPVEKWPLCRLCQKPMSLMMQWRHDPKRLDLGKTDQVLFAFQCDWRKGHLFMQGKQNWGGAETRLFLLPSGELEQGLTYPPDPGCTVFPEARVQGYDCLQQSAAGNRTFLGGAPQWLRTETIEVPQGIQFLGQISSQLCFDEPLPDGVRQNNVHPWPRFHGRFDASATGFGGSSSWACPLLEAWHSWSSGAGYLFLQSSGDREGMILWQWTDVMSALAPPSDSFAGLGVVLSEEQRQQSLMASHMLMPE